MGNSIVQQEQMISMSQKPWHPEGTLQAGLWFMDLDSPEYGYPLELLHSYGKSPCAMGKPTIDDNFP